MEKQIGIDIKELINLGKGTSIIQSIYDTLYDNKGRALSREDIFKEIGLDVKIGYFHFVMNKIRKRDVNIKTHIINKKGYYYYDTKK